MVNLNESIKQLPKTDLHCHLDGSLRIESILDVAEKEGIKLPADNKEGLEKRLIMTKEKCKSLDDYLEAFQITLKVLQSESSLSRVAYELLEDCAKDNVWYVEVRFSPILHQRKGLKLVQIMDAVIDGLTRGEKNFGVKSCSVIN